MKYFIASLILAGVAGTFLLADNAGGPLLPGSQPERVSAHLEGSILLITVYDASVITKVRRISGTTSEVFEMIRVVTRQSEPEGWNTVLAAGHLPGLWQDDDGYFEHCYVELRKIDDVWKGTIAISPTPSLAALYVCTTGWYEDAMILGLTIDRVVSPMLQRENAAEVSALEFKPAYDLADNRMTQLGRLAEGFPSQTDIDEFVARHVDLGLKWYRLGLDWLDWNEVVETQRYSNEAIDPSADVTISTLRDQGVSVMLNLVYWDSEIPSHAPPERRFATDVEIDRYVDYVRAVVRHFRGRVTSYALLNEPNVPGPGQQYVPVEDYINLVRRVVPAIREEDPQAEIVIGEITPLWDCGGLDYLFAILDSDILPIVDGIAWHWGGASPELHGDFYYAYPQLVETIRQTSIAGGFRGELHSEEVVFRTTMNPNPHEYMGYRIIPATKYMARVATMNLGLGLATGFALENLEKVPSFVRLVRNLSTVMAGHRAIHMPVEIQIDHDGPISYCTFRYPNGDRMLGIWTDGVAQDGDPGVPATIIFPGLSAISVTGIDVLHGYEQALVFDVDNNTTLASNVLIKDYPIFIRLRNVAVLPGYEETDDNGFRQLGSIPSP